MICPSCRATGPATANFCSNCGAPLSAGDTDTGPQGRLAGLDLSDEVLREVLTDVAGESRLVSVLFADMSQSVRRTAHLHPEESALLVNRLLEEMVDSLLTYEGRIDRFLGDGVLATFGTPEVHEDDPERAIRAALEIRGRAEELGLGITVGVNSGEVYFGPVGSALHREITVMGPVVNLASRLQAEAAEGEVLIGEATYRQVRGAFETTPRSLDIKGMADPVPAYEVIRLLERPQKTRGIEGFRSELIGRDEEVSRLRATLEDALDGKGQVVALVGEAGVGKSRLLAELRAGNRCLWLEGGCTELGKATGYWPFADLLRTQFGWEQGDSETARAERIIGSLEELAEAGAMSSQDIDDVGPFLGHLVSVSFGNHWDRRVEQSDPRQRREQTFAAVRRYLLALVARGPLTLVLEDMHWADDLSVDLVGHLMQYLADHPVLLVCTFRPSPQARRIAQAASAACPGLYHELHLGELSSVDSRRMMASLLHDTALPATVERLVLERSQGNPFYLEEMLRSLIDEGVVFREGEAWRAGKNLEELSVPQSIHGVIMSRVDRLEPSERRTAQVASILGRAFPRDLVLEMMGPTSNPEVPLAGLMEAGLVFREPTAAQGELAFLHALAQEAVYQSILPSRRAALHESAGRALEVRSAPPQQVAYHYERSRNHRKAVASLVAAGEQAQQSYLNQEAISFFGRALDRLTHVEAKDHREVAARVGERMGEVLELEGRHHEALDAFEMALASIPADGGTTRARLHRKIGDLHRVQRRHEEAQSSFLRAHQILGSVASAQERDEWIELQVAKAWLFYFAGREEDLMEVLEGAAQTVERYGTTAQRAAFVRTELLLAFKRERWVLSEETVRLAEKSLVLAKEAGDPGQIANAGFGLGFSLLWAGRTEDADRELQEALSLAERSGDAVLQSRTLGYLAVAARKLGRLEETRQLAEQTIEVADRADMPEYVALGHANLAWVAWREGDLVGVREHGRRWDKGSSVTHFRWTALWPLIAGELQDGNTERAADHARRLFEADEHAVPEPLGELLKEISPASERAAAPLEEAVRLAERLDYL